MQDDFLIRESTEMLDDCSVQLSAACLLSKISKIFRYIFSHQEK